MTKRHFWYFLLSFWRTIKIHKSGRSFSEAVSRVFPKMRTAKNNWRRSSRFVVSLITKWADSGQGKLIAFSLESKILRGSKSVYSSTTRYLKKPIQMQFQLLVQSSYVQKICVPKCREGLSFNFYMFCNLNYTIMSGFLL